MAPHPPARLGSRPGNECCATGCDTCERLRVALVVALADDTLRELTEARLSERAGLPRTAFDSHYRTVADCFLAAYEEISDEVLLRFGLALEPPGDWHDRMDAAFGSIIDTFGSAPGGPRLFVEACRSGDHRVRQRRATVRHWLARRLRESCDGEPGPERPAGYFEFLCGAVSGTMQEDFAAGCDVEHVRERVRDAVALFEPVPV
jgi:AcrR family transcriptional regulator